MRRLAGIVALLAAAAVAYAAWDYSRYQHVTERSLALAFTGGPRPDAEAAAVRLNQVRGIAPDDRPEGLQGCFGDWIAVPGPDREFVLAPAAVLIPKPPIWLRCFDGDRLAEDLASGAATAYAYPVYSEGSDLRLIVLAYPSPQNGGVFWSAAPAGGMQ